MARRSHAKPKKVKSTRNDAKVRSRNAARRDDREWRPASVSVTVDQGEQAAQRASLRSVAAANEIVRARLSTWLSYSVRAMRLTVEGPVPADDYGGAEEVGRRLGRERGAASGLVACVRDLARATDELAGSVRSLYIRHVQGLGDEDDESPSDELLRDAGAVRQ